MIRDTKQVGDVSEAILMATMLKNRWVVLLPFGERHRYDLVLEDKGAFLRVQCKTGRLRAGAIRFNTSSVVRDAQTKKYIKRYYGPSDIDLYGVYCPEMDQCYLIPVLEVARTEGCLRVVPSLNSTRNGGHLAELYEIEKFRRSG